jgi:hypothetical protein
MIDDEPLGIAVRVPLKASRTGKRFFKQYRERDEAMQKLKKIEKRR